MQLLYNMGTMLRSVSGTVADGATVLLDLEVGHPHVGVEVGLLRELGSARLTGENLEDTCSIRIWP